MGDESQVIHSCVDEPASLSWACFRVEQFQAGILPDWGTAQNSCVYPTPYLQVKCHPHHLYQPGTDKPLLDLLFLHGL